MTTLNNLWPKQLPLVLTLILYTAIGWTEGGRPFWTEKSAYVEGDFLYTVGLASNAKTREDGRKNSFANGRQEISNFIQLSDLDKIEIETQMTFEEPAEKGAFNVYRLLKTDYSALVHLKELKEEKAQAQIAQFNLAQQKAVVVRKKQVESIRQTQAELQTLDGQYEALVNSISETTRQAIDRVRAGMTANEIIQFVGSPGNRMDCKASAMLNYRQIWIILPAGIAACRV